jgi:hypothetical protein
MITPLFHISTLLEITFPHMSVLHPVYNPKPNNTWSTNGDLE